MVEKHLPKVFALNVAELRHDEREIEAHFDCIIPVDSFGDRLLRIVDETALQIPQPRFLEDIEKRKALFW